MRIKKYDTKAYVLSNEALKESHRYFEKKKKTISRKKSKDISYSIKKYYTPVIVFAAVKQSEESPEMGAENLFHIDLNDGGIVSFQKKDSKEKLLSVIHKDKTPHIQKNDLLMRLTDLSPRALKTLGYLMEHGTTSVDELDAPSKKGVRELVGRKYAEKYTPEQVESDLTKVTREILNWDRVTRVQYVKPSLNIPFFTSQLYNVSRKLRVTDVVEDSYEKKNVNHTPEKLGLLLGTLFSCQIIERGVVYLPCLECVFKWRGGRKIEHRYPACLKDVEPAEYEEPEELKSINIGTKGHGLESTPVESVAIDFSNVAGMEEVKKEIRSSIIDPLKHPELSDEYGKKGGGGALFYGPPGCGKTYLARATVGETGYNFFSASIQDVMGQDPKQGASQLHKIFAEARQGSPSILFFDEIDALGGRRSEKKDGGERMIINQFLTEMEGVGEGNRDVLIIGASNAPWDIDPALRRSGRFTKQIFIPPPDREARKALIKLNLKERPVEDDVDFDKLAEHTKEYSSADITAICEEAAQIPWNESLHGGERRGINMEDFQFVLNAKDPSLTPWLRQAEKQIRKSGESDMYPELAEYVFKRAGGIEAAEHPEMDFSQVSGLQDVKEEIKGKIVYPLTDPDLAAEYGRKAGGGLLLYGPPGCGKTYIARATAGECQANFYNIKLTDLLSSEQGEPEKRLHAIFERAKRNTPAIIFFDEIDAVASQRSTKQTGMERRLVNQLLTEMDGFEQKEGVMILAATNTPWDIDPALRRPGRFSDQIYLPPPDRESREEIFRISCQGKPVSKEIDYDRLAKLTPGYSSADISNICGEAARIPWREAMDKGDKRKINMQDFKQVLSERDSSLVSWFKQAREQIGESGEEQAYPRLVESINRWEKSKRQAGEEKEDGEKKRIEKEIRLLKDKYENGEIDKEVYDDLLGGLEKKLLEIQARED